MDIGDIQFRVGLIISVIALGSIFAGGVMRMIDEDGPREAERIAGAMRMVMDSLMAEGSGGTARIDLSHTGTGLRLSPTIDDCAYIINVLPSLVYISWSDGKEIVSKIRVIVPAYPPIGGSVDGDLMPEMMSLCEGIRFRTPCSMMLDRIDINGSSYIMFHPCTGSPDPDISALMEFLDNPSLPTPGRTDRITIGPFDRCRFMEEAILVWDQTEPVSCPHPIIVPPTYSIDYRGDVEGIRIIASKESKIGPDGNVAVYRTITAS